MEKKSSSKTVLPAIVILVLGALAAAYLIFTAPETQPEDNVRSARIVQTLRVSPSTEAVRISAEGTVMPARRVVMRPEIRGRVVRQNSSLVPGGYLDEGEELLGIDPADYELALTEKQAALEEARFEHAVETGRQVVASREWSLLRDELPQDEVNRALVLREPHLRRTEAMLKKASNEIARASLDLDRASIRVPFNALVLEESAEIGQLVEPGNAICTLVGTDEFWVQATLSMEDLARIQLPRNGGPGAAVKVLFDQGGATPVTWDGEVVRLLSDLEESVRMARLIIRVRDPMGLDSNSSRPPLLLGSYVSVQIHAGELEGVLAIPRLALREGERLWVVDANNELQIRDAVILSTRGEELLIKNVLEPGETLVVSSLKAALPGTKVDPQPPASP